MIKDYLERVKFLQRDCPTQVRYYLWRRSRKSNSNVPDVLGEVFLAFLALYFSSLPPPFFCSMRKANSVDGEIKTTLLAYIRTYLRVVFLLLTCEHLSIFQKPYYMKKQKAK